MKYVKQFGIILGFSFLGEVLHALIPFPVPASIYGLVLLAAALLLRLVRPEQLRETAGFLIVMMSLAFVGPCVNLMDSWDELRPVLLPVLLVVVLSTVLTFGISGTVTERLLGRDGPGSPAGKEDKADA